jgi:hypothetical protein
LACKEKSKTPEKKPVENSSLAFSPIHQYPVINDTLGFINELCRISALTGFEECKSGGKEFIKTFLKSKLKGSDKEFYFIDYEYPCEVGVLYPWRHLIVLDSDGNFLCEFPCIRWELKAIQTQDLPHLIVVSSTFSGNGSHGLYAAENDTLKNFLGGLSSYFPRTYDNDNDGCVNEPAELKLTFQDINEDQFNDAVFLGSLVSHSRIVPVQLIFSYEPHSKKFVTTQPLLF